jgi:glycosyltransferase involved in cell wall biosynthesis
MKIAIIAPTAIPARSANSIQVMKMAQALVELGHEVHVAAPEQLLRNKPNETRWDKIALHYGLRRSFPLEWLPANAYLRRYDYAWRGVGWARGWGTELIYTRLPQAAALASLLGVRTILEAHDLPGGTMGPILFRLFLRGRGALRLVVISQALERDMRERTAAFSGPPFALVAPDGVDLARYAGLPEPSDARQEILAHLETCASRAGGAFNPARFTVGYTGHLYAGRGINLILKMAKCLPEVNFLIVGGEPADFDRLVESIREAGSRNVVPVGFVPNADLPIYQATCEVLLLPYQHRVAASSGGDIAPYLSPMKLFEYLACGRAVCSSDLPVLREILSEGNAVLLPPDDVTAWVSAIQDLQVNVELLASLSEAARRTAEAYSWEHRAMRILEGI